MGATLTVCALDPAGRIYALRDEKGNTVGTGTREVCEVLIYLATKTQSSGRTPSPLPHGANVRAAIKV